MTYACYIRPSSCAHQCIYVYLFYVFLYSEVCSSGPPRLSDQAPSPKPFPGPPPQAPPRGHCQMPPWPPAPGRPPGAIVRGPPWPLSVGAPGHSQWAPWIARRRLLLATPIHSTRCSPPLLPLLILLLLLPPLILLTATAADTPDTTAPTRAQNETNQVKEYLNRKGIEYVPKAKEKTYWPH